MMSYNNQVRKVLEKQKIGKFIEALTRRTENRTRGNQIGSVTLSYVKEITFSLV